MAESPPICDYEGSDYRARFWQNQGRDYEAVSYTHLDVYKRQSSIRGGLNREALLQPMSPAWLVRLRPYCRPESSFLHALTQTFTRTRFLIK